MLHLRKLLQMRRIRPLISKILPNLKHLFKSSNGRLFEWGFKSDSEINIGIVVIMMGNKWSCCRSRSRIIQNRSLNLNKVMLTIKIPQSLIKLGLKEESRIGFRIHRHIKISFSIQILLIAQAVEFFRQRSNRLGKKFESWNENCEFSFVSFEDFSFYSNEISEIHHLFHEFVSRHHSGFALWKV